MSLLAPLVIYFLKVCEYLIIIMAAMSWLIGFNIVNIRNNVVRTIWYSLNLVTEPILSPIRRILPSLGGVDLSPLVALLVILFVQQWVRTHS